MSDGQPVNNPASAELVSFVPRLTLEWLRDHPESQWREVEGTLAFVDISGFTAMSERLSSLGRAGAEEVTEVMNATFAALLAVAYAQGGGLLKFGGDALLLLYEGDDHAARAARAAFEMRSTLRAIGRPKTSAGSIQLKMHAGIHSGRFQFFLVGESHRELLVTGPAATRTVEMEAVSKAGEILLSEETAALLGEDTIGDDRGMGRLLRAAPEVRGTVQPLPNVEGIALEVAVPAPLRAQLLEVGPLEGEHRNAAVAFIRFGGTDEVIATEGPEATGAALDRLVRIVQACAEAHGVTFLESDVDRDGGRVILVSGAPQTFGDDEERMLRTVRAILDEGLPFPVHIGVSQGRVFTGQVGASFRRTYTVLGDTAALAARLMARAGEDEVWVSSEAFSRGGALFEASELEPFQVKGKSEPVHAVVLGELVRESTHADRTEDKLPFVDRERERAVLAASVAPVRMGFGTLVELVGEPGIGKSRLAEELRENCADMRQISLRCEQYETSTPYYAFRPFLRSLLDVELNGGAEHNRAALAERLVSVDVELVPWAPLLAAPLDVDVETTPEVDDLEPSFRRARLHGVVSSLLAGLLDSPTLLVVEDVHWMDDASSELLRHLGTQLPTRPWLTCTTRRAVGGGFAAAEGTPPLPALTLRLEPLPEDDARTLVRAAAGDRRLSDADLAALMERGAGNPLFLQELASPDQAREAPEQMPDTVETLVATRIDGLAPGDRALLRWASVLGGSFSGALIAAVLEGDSTAASDSEAWDRLGEFVERDPDVPGAFRFRHALIRDGAYEGLSYRRRRELHARVAAVLEVRTPDAVELLSLHYYRADDRPATWRYSLEAGRSAQEKWANLEAVAFYRRALDASRSVSDLPAVDVAVVWESLGDCLRLVGELEEAARAYASARQLLSKDALEQLGLMRKEGLLREDMGKYTDAIRWYNRGLKAIDLLPEGPDRTHTRLEFNMAYAQARYLQGALRECIRRCEEVVPEALEAGDTRNVAWAYALLFLAHTLLGSPERKAFAGIALPLFEELGDLRAQASALNNLGIAAYYDGDWDKAADLYERSRGLHERIGDVTHVGMTNINIGEILSDQGHLEEAEQLFEDVVSTSDAIGQELYSAVARANLGRAAARAGRFVEAAERLEDALGSFRSIGAGSFVLETTVRLAEVDVLRGEDADQALTRVGSVLGQTGEADSASLRSTAHRIRAAALLQLGDTSAASTELEQSIHVAREADAAYELALALDLAALSGIDPSGGDESRALFEQLGVERVARPPVFD
jgi:class 3 adenylate cyclase/tetratricopeptide (TPR) repeat protein